MSKKKTNDPHDVRMKLVFGNKEAFLSLLADCVKADWLRDLDTDSLKKSETSFILQDFKKKEADVIYEATLNNGKQKVIFYVLLELQSKVDYRMPYRLLLYIVEVLRHYFNNADEKKRKQKGFKFPAVVPIVFYSGSRRWTTPLNLRGMFDGEKRFGSSLIDFNYALVDVKGYDDESAKAFQSRLLKVIMMFEKTKNMEELQGVAERYKSEISKLNEEELRILEAAFEILGNLYGTDNPEVLKRAMEPMSAERVSGMFTNLIENEKKQRKILVKQSREEGREEGREVGREEGREEGVSITTEIIGALVQGEPINEIASRYNMPADRVRQIQLLLSQLPPKS